MRGYHVERRFGWDCHGLPVENLVEKELGLKSKSEIEKYGIAKFNEACRSTVLRYTKEWRTVNTRLGRWVDFDNDYKTMDPDYMETIWWVFKTLWDKGLIYEGYYILPYCPHCATVLSNQELSLGGYKDDSDPAITLRFKITSTPEGLSELADGRTYFVAWTTTPWTLPSNLALSLGPDVDYVCIEDGADRYIMAEARIAAYYKDPASVKILWRKKGSELAGIKYEPLFPYFANLTEKGAFVTVTGSHVTTEDGTGIVHTAPGFGEDDYAVLRGTGIPTVCPVDAECKFTDEVPDYKGIFVKDSDKAIMERLKRSVDPTDILERYIAVVESVTESPLTRGNKVALLIDGKATYAAMFEAIRNAKDHINLETFIIEDDEIGGKFTDLLLAKRAQGIQVNIIYDSVGSITTPESFSNA